VHQFELVGQQLVDALADQRVGLAAAHLHDRPRPGDRGRQPLGQAPGDRGVVVLVAVLHRGPSSSSSVISSSNAQVRAASASSTTAMANPTCTTTWSSTSTSGTYARHTSRRIPPKSTVPLSSAASRSIATTRPGT